ncbi:MAG TPA: hypothetical protein VJ810_22255 [Blastocatellia bacterium]|nr:hypothetical protein [Blastocatellia bacterium]
MKAITLLLIMWILASADRVQNSQSPQASRKDQGFDYTTQIGILVLNEDKQHRLEIKNPNLAPNEKVVIVDVDYDGRQTIKRAEIVEKVSGVCSERGVNDKGDACYKLRAVSGDIDQSGAAFVIAKTSVPLTNLKGRVSADLDKDGKQEHFRVCTSMEGLHMTVWSGTPLKGKRQWHRYFYLGWDVEPNCKDGEGDEMPDK